GEVHNPARRGLQSLERPLLLFLHLFVRLAVNRGPEREECPERRQAAHLIPAIPETNRGRLLAGGPAQRLLLLLVVVVKTGHQPPRRQDVAERYYAESARHAAAEDARELTLLFGGKLAPDRRLGELREAPGQAVGRIFE